jgi:Mg2+ and Co2+ transporter CorA
MKKKIINGILMVALLAATSTSFVSCKDNDEDVKTDLTAQLQKLNGDYQAADAALNNAIQAQLANKANQSDLDAFKAAVQDGYVTKAEFDPFKTKVTEDIADLYSKLTDDTNPESAFSKIKAINEALAGQAEDIADIQEDIEKVNDTLKSLKKQISAIVDALSNMVTSVTINATSNSILANSKVFPGLDMQIVGAAYGEPINAKGAFPSKESGLSEAALAGVEDLDGFYKWEDGELITNDKDGYNAGTLYFTLNPSNVNPNNVKSLTLVNSLGKEIFELGKATPSQEVLTWGITRGEYPANLWEAPVKYDVESVKAIELKNIINFSELKDNVKNIIDAAKSVNKSKSSVQNASTTILKETASAVATLLTSKVPAMPAVALKATWEDTVGVRSVLSDYSIAATAYKPLSFSEFNGVSIGTDINFNKVDKAVAKIVKKLQNELKKINKAVNKIDISKITVEGDFSRSYTFYYELKEKDVVGGGAGKVQFINNLKIVGEGGTAPTPAGEYKPGTTEKGDGWWKLDEFSVNYNEDITELVNSIKKGFDVTSLINEVSSAIKSANKAANRVANLEKDVTDFLESYIKRTINFVSSGRILEPILLVNTSDGISRATRIYEADTYTFIPTTLNYELIAPAFKKYIAVLDKDGKVIKGSQKILTKGDKNFSSVEIELTKDAAQIVYAAMDFRGYQVAKVYDITVE